MDKSEISRANTVFKFVNFLWRIAKRRWFSLLIFHKHIHASYLDCFVTSWVQFYVLIVVGMHLDQKKTSSNLETKLEISLVTLCVAMLHVEKLCVEMRTAILVMVQPEAAKNIIVLPYLLRVFGQTGLSKQSRPRWDAAKCGISSGSTLFATQPAIFRQNIG